MTKTKRLRKIKDDMGDCLDILIKNFADSITRYNPLFAETAEKYTKIMVDLIDQSYQAGQQAVFDYIDKHYLEYCREQNGLPYCKNCGLDLEELKKELEK